jgi:hypothetical protein
LTPSVKEESDFEETENSETWQILNKNLWWKIPHQGFYYETVMWHQSRGKCPPRGWVYPLSIRM